MLHKLYLNLCVICSSPRLFGAVDLTQHLARVFFSSPKCNLQLCNFYFHIVKVYVIFFLDIKQIDYHIILLCQTEEDQNLSSWRSSNSPGQIEWKAKGTAAHGWNWKPLQRLSNTWWAAWGSLTRRLQSRNNCCCCFRRVWLVGKSLRRIKGHILLLKQRQRARSHCRKESGENWLSTFRLSWPYKLLTKGPEWAWV